MYISVLSPDMASDLEGQNKILQQLQDGEIVFTVQKPGYNILFLCHTTSVLL